MASDEIIKRQAILLIFRRAFDMAPSSEIFWTALSERRVRLELGGATKPETDTFGHEPALVARCCSPAKLLGFPKLVGIPRCNDARRRHQCDWHSQGGPAAMASCRTSGQLRRVGHCNDPTTERSLDFQVARALPISIRTARPMVLAAAAGRPMD